MEHDFVLWIVVGTALAFDFTNGFHDTANAVATSISTRALSPRLAVTIAALFRSGSDPTALLSWKEIHEQLEEAVDACENASDVLEAVLVKNR